MGTAARVRWPTTTFRTPGHEASASSALAFNATVCPRRQPSSWVRSTSQRMSFSRSARDSAEKPPKTTVCGAPSRAHASIATGSPGPMPM